MRLDENIWDHFFNIRLKKYKGLIKGKIYLKKISYKLVNHHFWILIDY
jgi:hypothetical protein